jgi:hypothetical protein
MHAGVAEIEFVLAVSQNFAQPRVVEEQAAVVINHEQRRWTKLQHLAKLALVLGRLGSRSSAAIARRRSARCRVRRHAVSAGLSRRTLASKPAEFEACTPRAEPGPARSADVALAEGAAIAAAVVVGTGVFASVAQAKTFRWSFQADVCAHRTIATSDSD